MYKDLHLTRLLYRDGFLIYMEAELSEQWFTAYSDRIKGKVDFYS